MAMPATLLDSIESTPRRRVGPAAAMRPRERMASRGAAALADAELLALLIGSGTVRASAQRIGRRLARRSPGELASWSQSRWRRVPALGAPASPDNTLAMTKAQEASASSFVEDAQSSLAQADGVDDSPYDRTPKPGQIIGSRASPRP